MTGRVSGRRRRGGSVPPATALAPLVGQGGANVVSFSNDEQAAQRGVWIMGIAAPPQVRRVVDHAVDAGVKRVNVSIDSLQRDRFFEMTRRDSLPQVLRGLEETASFVDED